MSRLIHRLVVGGALLVIGGAANAQPPGRYDPRDNPYHTYGREPLDRVRGDLNRAARNLNYLSEGEMRRFDRVRERIAEFQRKWERGRFDREDLDEVIAGLNGLIERNRLRPRDREILMDDVERLRHLRERYDREFRHR